MSNKQGRISEQIEKVTSQSQCAQTTKAYKAQLDVAIEAARLAGSVILQGQSGTKVSIKSGVDLVTAVDHESERVIVNWIHESFPNDLVIGEEDFSSSGKNKSKQGEKIPSEQPVWCIDPVDGTTNFVHNYPLVTVSIAYCVEGIPRVGVIYNPFLNELYEAVEGQGAMCNGEPIHVDSSTSLSDCLLVNNIGHTRNEDFIKESTGRIAKWLRGGLRGYRSSGSAAQNMAHVASGKVSCFYEHGYGGPWDVSAGMVLVQEAGGVVKNARHGEDFILRFGKGSICCGNEDVVRDVLRVAERPKVQF